MEKLTQTDKKLGNLYVNVGRDRFESITSSCKYYEALKKLAEYEEAEEQGKLIRNIKECIK